MGVWGDRPPGPGPVFEFEFLIATRRWQGYALRSLAVLLLLIALVVTWSSREMDAGRSTIRTLAEIGKLFYVAVIGTQLTLVLLVAPAATAGAICLDRARGTLTHLLVTDLSDTEIVLGKLTARLVPVLGLLGCSLPVMALLTLLGGVDPEAMLGAFAVTLGLAVLGSALALVFSLWAGKTHEALLGTYAVLILWLLSGMMINPLNGAFGLSLIAPPRTADPFYLAFAPYLWPGRVGRGDYLAFLGVTWAISAVLTAVAVLRLRPVCTTQNVRRTGRGWSSPGAARILGLIDRAKRPIGPSLDANPVLWREWHRNRPSRWTRNVGALYFTTAATFSLISVVWHSQMMMVLVNCFQVSIGLLLLSVSGATSLSEERIRGSLDVLMATPLSTREIVHGKWLGSFRTVPRLAVLPGLVIVFGGGSLWMRCLGLVAMVGYVVCWGAALTSLGLAMATWCSRLGRAVGLTVTAYVGMTVGWMFLIMATTRPSRFGYAMITGSPFYGPLVITVDACGMAFGGSRGQIGWAFFWMAVGMITSWALLAATLGSFDRSLGRIEAEFAMSGPRRPRKVVPVWAEDSFEVV